jgi:two-component system chemotaxis response regulator CheB
VIAVVLSGRLDDGAAGVVEVKRAGGRVLVQNQATAECFGMPGAAIATGCVDFVLPVGRIAPALVALVMAPGRRPGCGRRCPSRTASGCWPTWNHWR